MNSLIEIKKQLTDEWMNNATIQEKFGFIPGTSFDSVFAHVSVVNIVFYVVAYVVWMREKALESWRNDVDKTAIATRYGTKEWWHKTAIAWQDGDLSEVIDGGVSYSVVDQAKQKVKFCAVVEEGRTLYLKVAGGNSPSLASLTVEELGRFQAYLGDVKPLGVRAIGQSYSADELQITGSVYYDGELLALDIENEVKKAIETYLSGIVFGGMIYKTKLIDAVQRVEGVKDFELSGLEATAFGESAIVIGRNYEPKAGWARVSGYSLNLIVE